jgi:hypothetical protein
MFLNREKVFEDLFLVHFFVNFSIYLKSPYNSGCFDNHGNLFREQKNSSLGGIFVFFNTKIQNSQYKDGYWTQ